MSNRVPEFLWVFAVLGRFLGLPACFPPLLALGFLWRCSCRQRPSCKRAVCGAWHETLKTELDENIGVVGPIVPSSHRRTIPRSPGGRQRPTPKSSAATTKAVAVATATNYGGHKTVRLQSSALMEYTTILAWHAPPIYRQALHCEHRACIQTNGP